MGACVWRSGGPGCAATELDRWGAHGSERPCNANRLRAQGRTLCELDYFRGWSERVSLGGTRNSGPGAFAIELSRSGRITCKLHCREEGTLDQAGTGADDPEISFGVHRQPRGTPD